MVRVGTATLDYDGRGNLLSDGAYLYTWDNADRLASVEVDPLTADLADADRVKLSFTYDHQHRRTSKTVARWDSVANDFVTESVTKFIYDGHRLVAETNADNELIRSYVWAAVPGPGGVGGLRAIRVHAPTPGSGFPVTNTYWAISDDNGNVTALVDADSEEVEVAASYQYTPYGQTLHAEGDAAALANNPFGFSTKYHDAELPGADLVYYGYRYYHPALQVWLNRDPIAEDGGLNLYAFCLNQPNNLIDPYGLTSEGHHVVGRELWRHHIETMDPETLKIFKEARLTSPAYEATYIYDHNGKRIETVLPTHNGDKLNGISTHDYNQAIQRRSIKEFGGRFVHQLNPDQARQLVADINIMTDNVPENVVKAEAKFKDPHRIGAYNRGVLSEIEEAENVWRQRLGLSNTEQVKRADIKRYRESIKQATRAEEVAAKRVARLSDTAKRLPSFIAPVFIFGAYQEGGSEAAGRMAVETSPYADVRDIVTGIPEAAVRGRDTVQAVGSASENYIDQRFKQSNLRYDQSQSGDPSSFDDLLNRRARINQDEDDE